METLSSVLYTRTRLNVFLWPVYQSVTRSSILLNGQDGYYISSCEGNINGWLELKTTELAVAAVKPTRDSVEGIAICYVCGGPNHIACDCSHLTQETEIQLPKSHMLPVYRTISFVVELLTKRTGGGRVDNASLVPGKNVKVCAANASRMEFSQIKKIQY